jgi:carbon starvation protein
MNSLVVAGVSVFLLVLGYIFYSRKVKQWIGLDDSEVPPAVQMNDGVDYIPARHWTVLFGHHFATIAGAAPIIGPVIACLYFGWLPALIWIVVGGIFFGGVHDFVALVMSLRNQGKSITTVTESVMGRSSRVLFSTFAFLTLILVVAVFAAAAAKTLTTTPQVVLPTFGLIFVALLVGILMYRVNLSILLCSVIGVAMLFALIVAGQYCPIELGLKHPEIWWTVMLLSYCMVASVTPVNILLQPRDYISGAVLYLGMMFGLLGIVFTHPQMKAPPFVAFTSPGGWLWPMMFVTIACGAISGFHSLAASGTTSKQLPRTKDARVIGYGAMIMESALAVLAVIAVAAGLYWIKQPDGDNALVYQQICKQQGWINAFGAGYGQLTKKLLGGVGGVVGIIMLNTFIMTTLDSATRIARYIANELLGETFGLDIMKNRYVAVLFVGASAGTLAVGNWQQIWPVFGAANQLIASVVLIVATVYLLSRHRRWMFTAIPAVIMLTITIAALVCQTYGFVTAEQPNILLAIISVVLIILAVFLAYVAMAVVVRIRGSGGH